MVISRDKREKRMQVPPEQKTYFLERYEAVRNDESADPREKMVLETAVTVIRLEPLITLAEEGQHEIYKLRLATEGLLEILFGDDVDFNNIIGRYKDLSARLEDVLYYAVGKDKRPGDSKGAVAELNLLLGQRVLVAAVGLYIRNFATHWIWKEDDVEKATQIFNILQKLIVYLKLIPTYLSSRNFSIVNVQEKNLDVSYENFAVNPNCGTATLKIDLLQPREAILKAFTDFVDKSKNEMRDNPKNRRILTFYDVRRDKDGRATKSLYKQWNNGIVDVMDAIDSDFKSFYEAAETWGDGENGRKNLEARAARIHTLIRSVLNDTFPSIDPPPSPSEN